MSWITEMVIAACAIWIASSINNMSTTLEMIHKTLFFLTYKRPESESPLKYPGTIPPPPSPPADRVFKEGGRPPKNLLHD